MKNAFKILLLLCSIFVCSNIAFGQLVSESYCKKIENTVAMPFNPAHWYHNIVFTNECWLSFDIDKKHGTNISFQLEKSETKESAKKSLKSDIEMYEDQHFIDRGKNMKMPKYERNNFWDKVYFYDSYGPMLLLKENIFITIFCDERKLCSQIEERLRKASILDN